jgi:hypothetical protein
MKPITIKDKQIAPCIISKARYALKISINKPINKKGCKKAYWIKVVDHLAPESPLNQQQIEEVKNSYERYIPEIKG